MGLSGWQVYFFWLRSEVCALGFTIYFLLREGREASGEKFVGDGLPVLLANQGLSK